MGKGVVDGAEEERDTVRGIGQGTTSEAAGNEGWRRENCVMHRCGAYVEAGKGDEGERRVLPTHTTVIASPPASIELHGLYLADHLRVIVLASRSLPPHQAEVAPLTAPSAGNDILLLPHRLPMLCHDVILEHLYLLSSGESLASQHLVTVTAANGVTLHHHRGEDVEG